MRLKWLPLFLTALSCKPTEAKQSGKPNNSEELVGATGPTGLPIGFLSPASFQNRTSSSMTKQELRIRAQYTSAHFRFQFYLVTKKSDYSLF